MIMHTQKILTQEIRGTLRDTIEYYATEIMKLPEWLREVA